MSQWHEKPSEEVILKAFQYADAAYEVRLQTIEGAEFAILHLCGTEAKCTLHPLPNEIPKGLSRATVESGYIAVAHWLVRTGRWPASQDIAEGAKSTAIQNSVPRSPNSLSSRT
jgi:hypothetical protein